MQARKKPLVIHSDEVDGFHGMCGLVKELLKPDNSDIRQLSIALITVEPRMAAIPHKHAVTEEVYYILEGEGIVTIDDAQYRLRRGHAVYIPDGCLHQIANTGATTLSLLTVNAPPYDPSDVEET